MSYTLYRSYSGPDEPSKEKEPSESIKAAMREYAIVERWGKRQHRALSGSLANARDDQYRPYLVNVSKYDRKVLSNAAFSLRWMTM